jgi:uncharacterized protein
LLCLCLIPCQSKAQTDSDLQLLSGVFQPENTQKTYSFAQNARENEYVFLLSKAFLMYKKLISSQDLNACNFHPSCSEFAMISVREMGLLKGVLNGFDRLTRCHPGAHTYYEMNTKTGKLSDPLIRVK